MDISDSAPPPEADFTAALPLDISEETASRTDDLLREFAEEAGLDTALVVDRSGALVAGISSEAEVTVEVVSALVAGASGAMRALVAQLGESGAMESLHLGGNRLIYLKETVGTFILVAVAEAVRPAGLVRQRALAIEGHLQDLLRDLRPADPAFPAGPASPAVKSLRETVRERAARRLGDAVPPMFPALPVATGAEPVFELDPGEDEEDEEDEEECVPEAEHEETPEGASGFGESFELPCDEEPGIEEVFGTLDLQSEAADTAVDVEASADDLAEDETGTEPSPIAGQTLSDLPKETPPLPPPVEPKEILEPIDFGEPEIVIEAALPEATGSRRLQVPQPPVDSPFEAEEDDEEKEDEDEEDSDDPEIGGLDSVFEFDAEGDEDEDLLRIVMSPEPEDTGGVADSVAKSGDGTPAPPVSGPFPASLFEQDDDSARETDAGTRLDSEGENPQEEAGGEVEGPEQDDGEEKTVERIEVAEEAELTPMVFSDGVAETILFEMPREPASAAFGNSKQNPPAPGNSDEGETGRELAEMIDEEEEESEIRASGPFYF